MFYTYAHYRADSATAMPFYIGKGSGKRAFVKRRSAYWKNVASKHGVRVELLSEWGTEQDAFEHEKLLISIFKDMGGCECNLTAGGEGPTGLVHSAKTRDQMRLSHQGKSASSEHRAAVAAIWDRQDVRQRHQSAILESWKCPARKEKQSIVQKALKSSPDAKLKMKNQSMAIWKNPELRARIIEKTKAALSGKKKTEAHVLALQAAIGRPVVCIDTGEVFKTVTEARNKIRNTNPKAAVSAISGCCNGKYKRAYGFSWKYIDKLDKLDREEQPMRVDVVGDKVTVTKGADKVSAARE
jgi:hypothetical protein